MIYQEQKQQWYQQQIDRIEVLKKEHKDTQEVLSDITKTLERDILLPINSVAFARASIYHTNETMVVLGNDYFVERSVHQTQEILQRRINVLDDSIKKLRMEYEEKKDLGVTFQMDDGSVEIIEPFEEEPAPVKKPIEKVESILKKPQPKEEPPRQIPSKTPPVEEVKVNKESPIQEKKPVEEEPKKQVSFGQVETKELPKKVSKFKQEMMDKRK